MLPQASCFLNVFHFPYSFLIFVGTWHQVLKTEGDKVTLGAKVVMAKGKPEASLKGSPLLRLVAYTWVGDRAQVAQDRSRNVEWRLELEGSSQGLNLSGPKPTLGVKTSNQSQRERQICWPKVKLHRDPYYTYPLKPLRCHNLYLLPDTSYHWPLSMICLGLSLPPLTPRAFSTLLVIPDYLPALQAIGLAHNTAWILCPNIG